MTKEYGKVLKQRLISVDLITDKKIIQSLDYFSKSNQEAQKLLYRINNSWLMSDVSRDLLLLINNYESRFGECHNKLRLILDLLSISHKLSFVFFSDGSSL